MLYVEIGIYLCPYEKNLLSGNYSRVFLIFLVSFVTRRIRGLTA